LMPMASYLALLARVRGSSFGLCQIMADRFDGSGAARSLLVCRAGQTAARSKIARVLGLHCEHDLELAIDQLPRQGSPLETGSDAWLRVGVVKPTRGAI
jgi:hypothetical protein